MATNPFFSNYSHFGEQQLIDSLVIESIKMHGLDMFYVSRERTNIDSTFNEDMLAIFSKAFNLELYVKSVDGFGGDGDFLSKFGLQINDQATFAIAFRTFERHVTTKDSSLVRPREGDLIYLPLNEKFFKIMHVEHEAIFYQMGKLQVYEVQVELFSYSNEQFATGVPVIDEHFTPINTDYVDNLADLKDIDPIARNTQYEETADDILDLTEFDPFSYDITDITDD